MTEEEASEWVKSKARACERDDMPPRVHKSNWRLDEYFFHWDGGRSGEKRATMEDSYNREAGDLGAGVSMIGGDDNGKKGKKEVTPSERYKVAVTKVNRASQRLGKLLGICDQKLPGIKKRLGVAEFQDFKQAMSRCRDCKEEALCALHDLKLPDDLDGQTACFDSLQTLQQRLSEHGDAIQDFLGTEPSAKAIKHEGLLTPGASAEQSA